MPRSRRRPTRSLLALVAAAALAAACAPLLAASPAAAAPIPTATTTPGGQLGYDRLGLRRGDTWFLQPDLDGGAYTTYAEETGGWMPVAGDTDGDGVGTVSLFRDGVWLIRDAQRGTPRLIRWGMHGDQPLLGDWDGDGVDSLGIFRRGTWFLRDDSVNGPDRAFRYGLGTDVAVVGDWNGDGRTDIAAVRNSTWFQRDAPTGGPESRHFNFGLPGDRRFSGDWDHDSRDTPGVFRSGQWFLRRSNFSGEYATASFGKAGDVPVVRRTPELAPGVSHRVIRDSSGPWAINVITVDLAAASSPDTVLARGVLRGTETTSSMARRSASVAAVNADFFLSNGRPVHAFGADGRLFQTPQTTGRAVGIDLTGRQVTMGFPDAHGSISAQTSTGTTTIAIPRWNAGYPAGDELAAFTAAGSGLESPINEDCYAGLGSETNRVVHPDGGIESSMSVTGSRCGGAAAALPSSGVLLEASSFGANADFVRGLSSGQAAQVTQSLGFPGAVDVVGGNPLLLKGGTPQYQDTDGSGSFFARNPRTALGVTQDGRMLLVTVDGRAPGYSVGMTLRELADYMVRLGATDAINLDGGGSTAMWVNGLLVNRPSDGFERTVGSAIVVLPGADPGETDLTLGTPIPGPVGPVPALRREPAAPLVSPLVGGTPVAGWSAAAADAGSIGGLADALAEQHAPMSAQLQRAGAAYDAAHR